MQHDITLHQHCLKLFQAVTDASAWVTENQDVVRSDQEGLQVELRRSGRIFRQCARAAMRKMCAGVFGPSQAGKSYLISALARDASGVLMALFGAEVRDFIEEINPEGGKEATGLVTRFTMTRPASLPEGFPVQIKLLTETDLVKIIANTYYADCEHREIPDTNAITKSIDELQNRKGTGSAHINLDALEDLREYLVKDFQAKARVQELDRCGYWKRIFDLGPQLDLESRVHMYSVIWDNVSQFTALLRLLLRALEKLGYAPEAFCPLEALIPRDGSIIDVATLAGLGDSAGGAELAIRTASDPPVSLPRSVVTALTAELTIVMREKPDDYFDHTDLLDFPGYRSRYKFSDVRKELEKPGMANDLFLRGKVAYLFQRYCAERELTSMLLCIGPSNQEVQDLPGVINDWVISTHGELPESRRDKPVALYFILTKFDMEFEEKKGAPSVETRWDNRLHASLLDFFGKQHDWPKIWDGKDSFRNMFLLRNPNFGFKAVLEYDENNREKGIRPDQLGYVSALESAFMNSKCVAAHFKDARGAWDAAMRLNDGGISYIRDSLRPLCNPAIKQAQIATTLAERKNRLALRLQAFYRSDDKEEERRQKTLLSRTFGQIFARMLQGQTMGEFIRRLCVQDNELYELYFEARRRFLESEEDSGQIAPQVSVGSGAAADDIFAELFGNEAPPEEAAPKDETPVFTAARPKDEAQYFAELIEAHWCNRLQALSDNPSIQKYYGFPPAELSKFAAELALGASRLKLREEMEKALRAAAAYSNTAKERIVWQQVGMAASLINAFVDWLGRNPRSHPDKEDRTVFMGGNSYVLFTPPKKPDGFPALPEMQESFEKAWFMDWLRALHVLLQENVDFEGGQMYNQEQNTRLGEIIQTVSSPA